MVCLFVKFCVLQHNLNFIIQDKIDIYQLYRVSSFVIFFFLSIIAQLPSID